MAGSRRRLLTPEQEAWVAECYEDMTNNEIADGLRGRFGTAVTIGQLAAWAKRQGLRKGAEAMRRTRKEVAEKNQLYTDEMHAFLREYIPGHVYPETAGEFERRFGWRPTKTQYKNYCMTNGVRSGVRGYGCFERGNTPANKGKTWDEYMSPEAQRRVREAGNLFEKGQRPHNAYHELLDMRRDKDGWFIYVKPRDAKKSVDNWISYARFVWMQHNGREFPEGCKCVHCDHDPDNFAPDNLMAVPNDVYAIVTGGARGHAMEYWDRESLRLAILHAKLLMTRRRAEKARPRRCGVCGKVFVPGERQWEYAERVRTCPDCLAAGRRAREEVNRP